MILLAFLIACQAPPTPPEPSGWYVQSGYCGFGMNVGAAGDVDRDGVPDWIVEDDGYSKENVAPRIWFLSGKNTTVLRSIELPSLKGSCRLIEGGHDVDADGVPDALIAIGAYAGTDGESGVHLVSGATGRILRTLPARTAWQDSGDWAGFVSDVDGDGARDVALLSRDADSKHRTVVVHSSRTGTQLSITMIESACGEYACGFLEIDGEAGSTRGYAVLLDGVGIRSPMVQLLDAKTGKSLWRVADFPEPAAESYGQMVQLRVDKGPSVLAVGYGDGVDLLDSATGKRVHRLTPVGKTDSEMGYGWDLAPLGDIDSDGIADVAVSETESGLSEGVVYAISGKTGAKLWSTAWNEQDVYRFGYSMASLGDIDGDGFVDLAVGTWGGKAGVPGRAFVLSGKAGTLLREVRRKGDSVIVKRETFPRTTR